jgi:hypothetical protein
VHGVSCSLAAVAPQHGHPRGARLDDRECHVIRFSVAGVIICVPGAVDCLTAQVSWVEVALPQVSFRGGRGINTLLAAAHSARLRALDFGLVGVRAELSAIG